MKRITIWFLNIIIFTGIFILVALPLGLILPGIPEIWYQLDASATDREVDRITADLGEQVTNLHENDDFVIASRPELDPSLPKENRIIIDTIGVNGKIYEGSNAKQALARGIWRTNTFGTPENNFPMILASHRYGNPNWSKAFRDKEILFNLDKIKVGDIVEIVWNQRVYRYKIYQTEVAKQISRNDFNLLLYTCNYWNSPLRIFAYAKRI